MPLLDPSVDGYFYNLVYMRNIEKWKRGIDTKWHKYYFRNVEKKNRFSKETHANPGVAIYKKKYKILYYDEEEKDKGIFNKKFKTPVTSLSIRGYAKISSLPKGLKILHCHFTSPFFIIPVEVLPLSIESLCFTYARVPFSPDTDLTHLKNLKVYICNGSKSFGIPKLPKSIEFISMPENMMGNGMYDYKKFRLKDYPNLKYLDVSKSQIPKKDIPKEWKEAKKKKKLFILY